MKKLRVAVLGATGYTGAELLRLLLAHPRAELSLLAGHTSAGEPVAKVLPSFAGMLAGNVEALDPEKVSQRADVAFCALPHGKSAPVVKALRANHVPTLDLSADFRLADQKVYEDWYAPHDAPELLSSAVYGLPELHREELRTADLVAVPGCYPTASILALAPLIKHGLVETGGLIIDAKSGVSGAGRSLAQSYLYAEASGGIRAYKVGGKHRHTPEIEQELSRLGGTAIRVTFTPHLVPMTRGILATAYARGKEAATAQRCTEAAREFYAGSPSLVVLDPGSHPDTLWVRGSNRVHVAYTRDDRTGLMIAQASIDNLVKGASGQAVQCMNLRFGFDEGEGLQGAAVFP